MNAVRFRRRKTAWLLFSRNPTPSQLTTPLTPVDIASAFTLIHGTEIKPGNTPYFLTANLEKYVPALQ